MVKAIVVFLWSILDQESLTCLPSYPSRERFVASNGSNVRALWVCAKGVGGMPDARWWCVLQFAQRCELNASKWWRKPTED